MQLTDNDTIAAISTPPGSGGIAVLRVSGPDALAAIHPLFSTPEKLAPRQAVFGHLTHPDLGEGIFDDCVVTFFKGPNSVTGEDLVEISIHGGAYLQHKLLDVLVLSPSVRLAGAGEFTLRSFLNGKIDLSRAEAVADLIHARDAAAHKNARQQLSGGLKALVESFAERLRHILVIIEAELDFSDQEINFTPTEKLLTPVLGVKAKTRDLIETYFYGKRLEDGFRVPIIGSPNSGKSSLFNLLLGQDRAIVTNQAGTTRDTIEKGFIFADHTVVLVDTAGIREAGVQAEISGVGRSKDEISRADFIIQVSAPDTEPLSLELPEDLETIDVYNKIDMDKTPPEGYDIYLSCNTRQGLDELKKMIYSHVVNISNAGVDGVIISSERHKDALRRFYTQLEACERAVLDALGPEYIASDIRLALDVLGEITGETTPDDILNQIFAGFCVGK
ncbi:MAG: tRNA uridine-5-carboxymethylaminomethyl(34) synthesis GTPase MnmE [Candidatus Marinimicrobia bacterium]|nr:tRNA uridine-5-carboxymethylaminomethyl(34) synthesis GTPase MnmE [Candidatus Neomarinimicrobiota bacterium]MCF7903867.1 tRNA uridine-5-carboxymethylaminomethyl(34) synthesis GTPase MnmE [Candidatus Neomarinimicrobiota bacterium]